MARDVWAEQEQRDRIYQREGGRCYTCGAQLDYTNFQLAHVIPQRKHWRARYGDRLIYCDDNMRATCPNDRCNNAQSLGNNQHACDQFAEYLRGLHP